MICNVHILVCMFVGNKVYDQGTFDSFFLFHEEKTSQILKQ